MTYIAISMLWEWENHILIHWIFINCKLINWLVNLINSFLDIQKSLNHNKQRAIFSKLAILIIVKLKKLKLNSINIANQNYIDISFDVIKRGSLLVLIIGLSFACLTFAFEVIAFFAIYFWINKWRQW